MTCLVGKRLGDPSTYQHYALRDYAASLTKLVCKRFGEASHTLRPRLTRTCLKHFLDPSKPLGTHYGAIAGLAAIGGRESVRVLIVPNLKLYEKVIGPDLEEDTPRKRDAEMVVEAIFSALKLLEEDEVLATIKRENGDSGDERLRELLGKRIGDVMAERVWKSGNRGLARSIVETSSVGPQA